MPVENIKWNVVIDAFQKHPGIVKIRRPHLKNPYIILENSAGEFQKTSFRGLIYISPPTMSYSDGSSTRDVCIRTRDGLSVITTATLAARNESDVKKFFKIN